MAKHPHYDIICEWAADTSKVVQWRRNSESPWVEAPDDPAWTPDYEYRIKPEKKPDVVAVGIIEVDPTRPINIASYRTAFRVSERYEKDNIRLTFDGETGQLKSAEVLHG